MPETYDKPIIKFGGKNGGGSAYRQGSVKQDRRGRFVSKQTLTPFQRRFVQAYVRNGGKALAAVRTAGTDGRRERQLAYDTLRVKKVKAAIWRERNRYLNTELATVALQAVRAMLTDADKTPAAVRFQAAKYVLETAGHSKETAIQTAQAAPDAHKPLTEFTISELDAFINAGSKALGEMRTGLIVDAELVPDDAQDGAPPDSGDDVLA